MNVRTPVVDPILNFAASAPPAMSNVSGAVPVAVTIVTAVCPSAADIAAVAFPPLDVITGKIPPGVEEVAEVSRCRPRRVLDGPYRNTTSFA